jgi:cytochrome c peroxidase
VSARRARAPAGPGTGARGRLAVLVGPLAAVLAAASIAGCAGAHPPSGAAAVRPPAAGEPAPSAPAPAGRFPAPLPEPLRGRLPPGFPPPVVPADNPLTAEKVALGRRLFYDRRLSGDGHFACASCHRQELAFTDGRPRAVGATGATLARSAMSLANAAYPATLAWDEPELTRLEDQALVPMLATDPIELGIAGREAEVLARLRADARYRELFAAAFPGDPDPFTLGHVTRALASFERTLLSGDSPYDRLLYRDDREALSPAARRGMALFFSAELACAECHAGFNLSGPVHFARAGGGAAFEPPPAFFNTALYDLGGGAYPLDNPGLVRRTGRAEDQGRFRAPTLRNVALTAPYMHDGSIATLGEVIDHYAAGGRAAGNPGKDSRLEGFAISAAGKTDLIAFLEALTDRAFVTDPRLADPFLEEAGEAAPRPAADGR